MCCNEAVEANCPEKTHCYRHQTDSTTSTTTSTTTRRPCRPTSTTSTTTTATTTTAAPTTTKPTTTANTSGECRRWANTMYPTSDEWCANSCIHPDAGFNHYMCCNEQDETQ